MSFELDVWGRLRRATEAARADLLAAEYNRKAVMTTLVSDVASAYFNLLDLDMELAIARRTLGVRVDSLELIRNRERGGLGTLLDVRQGEQLVYGAEQVIPALEQLIEQSENQISLLLGGAPNAIPRGRPLEEQPQPPAVPAGLPSSLLDRRPDIQAAEQNLVAANAIVGVARAAYFPRISLTGLLGFQSDQLAGLFSGPTRIWQFVPQVDAAYLQCRPPALEREPRQGTAGAGAHRVRPGDSDCIPRGVRRAGSVPEGPGDSRETGAARGHPPGLVANVAGSIRRGNPTRCSTRWMPNAICSRPS